MLSHVIHKYKISSILVGDLLVKVNLDIGWVCDIHGIEFWDRNWLLAYGIGNKNVCWMY